MSWWDTSQLTSFATSALKNAQKKIDRVLDIPTEENSERGQHSAAKTSSWSSWDTASSSLTDNVIPSSKKEELETVASESSEAEATTFSTTASDVVESAAIPERHEDTTEYEGSVNTAIAATPEPISTHSPSPPPVSTNRGTRRERAKRQRSSEKPQVSKKLGAVKLGAVKVKKLISSDEPQSDPQKSQSSNSVTSDSVTSDTAVPDAGPAETVTPDTILSRTETSDVEIAETVTSDTNLSETLAFDVALAENVTCDTNLSETVTSDNVQSENMASCTVTSDDMTSFSPAVDDNDKDELKNLDTIGHAHQELLFDQPSSSRTVDDPLDSSTLESKEPFSIDIMSGHNSPDLQEVAEFMTTGNTSATESHAVTYDTQGDVQAASAAYVWSAADVQSAADENSEETLSKHDDLVTEMMNEVVDTDGWPISDELILPKDNVNACVNSSPTPDLSDMAALSPDSAAESASADSLHQKPAELTALTDPPPSHTAVTVSISSQSDSSMGDTTPRAGSSADLFVKSASSDGTVTDQPDIGSDGAKILEEEVPDEMTQSALSSIMAQSTCSDNSYVKCERPPSFARVDSASDFNRKPPSEFSDFETGTSSDIEIISMASTYGDGNGEGPVVDFVPLGRSVFKTKIRDISPDEISVTSSQASPGSDHDETHHSTSTPAADKPSSADTNNPLDSQNLLKKLAQLSEVLEVRETKLLSASRENAELLEVNTHLKRRIEKMEETNGDLELVKGEFGQRLHDLERKLQNALREKDSMKKQMTVMQQELMNRAGTSDKMVRIVEDKDEQISSLMMEGEKLAKQQLQSNNLIKKLRKKEKEQEETSRMQREKIDSQQGEIERLKGVLDSKISNEKEHTDLIKQLNVAVQNYQSESSKLKLEAEEATDKMKRAESAVDNSYKEIAELHKTVASKDSQMKDLMSSNEQQLREELQRALERKQKEAVRDADHLTNQIEDLQITISRMEKEHSRREECLRQEITDLLQRLELSDKRNDDLTNTVSAATKPLLRQIENLQSSYSAQSESWEKLEKNLTDRLADAQNQLAVANEKERIASEQAMELSSRVSIMETQLSSLKQERSKFSADLEVYKMKLNASQDERSSALTQLESYRTSMELEKAEIKKSQTLLESKVELERTKTEAEKKRVADLLELINEKEQQLKEATLTPRRSTPSPSVSCDDAQASQPSRAAIRQVELLERALSSSSFKSPNAYDSMRNNTSTSLFENLQSLVRQKEGEIAQLQADIAEHDRTRESLTKEMIKLTEENSNKDSKIKSLAKLQSQYKELNARYQALLQMYGEKEEEVSELRMDLVDVKQMYKQQIDVLLSK